MSVLNSKTLTTVQRRPGFVLASHVRWFSFMLKTFQKNYQSNARYFFFSSNKEDQLVGVDVKGNQYFELNNGGNFLLNPFANRSGIISRQVKYFKNEYDPTLVHPLWLPWLQYKTDIIPSLNV
jgi:NADH:ubiquinone oxidoreductase subunit